MHVLLTDKAVVKCSQTGEQHIVKLKDLSKEDNQPILNDDLFEGSSLLVECNHKSYPVEFVKFKGLTYIVGVQCRLSILYPYKF